MKLTEKQIFISVLTVLCVGLLIFWLCQPGWERGKILCIISNSMLILLGVINFLDIEKKKRK